MPKTKAVLEASMPDAWDILRNQRFFSNGVWKPLCMGLTSHLEPMYSTSSNSHPHVLPRPGDQVNQASEPPKMFDFPQSLDLGSCWYMTFPCKFNQKKSNFQTIKVWLHIDTSINIDQIHLTPIVQVTERRAAPSSFLDFVWGTAGTSRYVFMFFCASGFWSIIL